MGHEIKKEEHAERGCRWIHVDRDDAGAPEAGIPERLLIIRPPSQHASASAAELRREKTTGQRKKWAVCIAAAAALSVGTAAADNIYTVSNTLDSGPGSLRQAILDANSHAGSDTIAFNIPGTGVRTIAPVSELPALTSPVTIDGYTQPGSSANSAAAGDNAALLIELNGASAGNSSNGLTLGAGSNGSVIKGLVINRFAGDGVLIQSDGNTIAGNFIGTNASGNGALANSLDGIRVQGSSNTIGGMTTTARNLISANSRHGISLGGGAATAQSNQVETNFIGTDSTGTKLLGNGGDGVFAMAATNNLVGGTIVKAGDPPANLIAGNAGNGVGAIGAVTALAIKGNSIHSTIRGLRTKECVAVATSLCRRESGDRANEPR